MGYTDLTKEDYASLSMDAYAQMTLEGTASGSQTASSCPWSSATVASLTSAISSLTTKVDNLATELAKVTARMPASGTVATSANITSAPTTAQIASAVWSASSREITGTVTVNNAQAATFTTATGFATPTNVTDAKDAILSRGNTAWTTASTSSLATSSDITSLQTHGDTNWSTATGFATSSDSTSINTLVSKIFALMANWSVVGNILTITVGQSSQSFALTKDSDGNITGVTPSV